MSLRRYGIAAIFAAVALTASQAAAEPTEVTVRVLSKGAKFIGSSMGGVQITIRDAVTDEILARGVTRGTTGSTRKIMRDEHTRGEPLATPDAAKFTATLDLEEPRLVEVTAYGPLAQRQAAMRASVTHWLVPGRDVTGGDGILLELPGFVVDVLAPPAHDQFERDSAVRLHANVTMMCGCPITPGGLWDANALEVRARVVRDGKLVGTVPLSYAGSASQFSAPLAARQPGTYEVTVYAYDPATGNTGLDATTFVVR